MSTNSHWRYSPGKHLAKAGRAKASKRWIAYMLRKLSPKRRKGPDHPEGQTGPR